MISNAAREERSGFALVAALWLTSVASFLMLALIFESRTDRLLAINGVAEVKAVAAARAGLAHALARIARLHESAGGVTGELAIVGRPWRQQQLYFEPLDSVLVGGGSWYRVSVSDASSQLPLNDLTEAEFRRFLAAFGVDAGEAEIVTQSVLDWRDADALYRANGAEWDDYYSQLQPPVIPRNGPFQSIAELRAVRGVTPELWARMAPHLTVLGTGNVNLNSASRPVLAALPGLGPEAIEVILDRQQVGEPFLDLFALEGTLSAPARELMHREFAALAARVSFEPRGYRIEAVGRVGASPITGRVLALAVWADGKVRVPWSLEE